MCFPPLSTPGYCFDGLWRQMVARFIARGMRGLVLNDRARIFLHAIAVCVPRSDGKAVRRERQRYLHGRQLEVWESQTSQMRTARGHERTL